MFMKIRKEAVGDPTHPQGLVLNTCYYHFHFRVICVPFLLSSYTNWKGKKRKIKLGPYSVTIVS